jgi:hypothetical protein
MLLAASVGFLYQKILGEIPIIYNEFFILVGCLYAVMVLGRLVVRIGKCRNTVVGMTVGSLMGLAVLASAHYAAYQDFNAELTKAASQSKKVPAEARAILNLTTTVLQVPFSESLKMRADLGWVINYKMRETGIVLKGPFYYLVLLLEASIVLMVGLGSGIRAASEPFCEKCDCWTSNQLTVREQRVAGPEVIDRIAQADQLEDLIRKIPEDHFTSGKIPLSVRYDLVACMECQQQAYLTISAIAHNLDRHGEEKLEKQVIWKDVVLSTNHIKQLADELEKRAGTEV